ncbi:MAG TPA: bifunctional DNA primase/polymerase, partial [Methylomirabilota bacterium]|nr:bifunctional DNA primase/polymerase [Methylomirabilota bacterium]
MTSEVPNRVIIPPHAGVVAISNLVVIDVGVEHGGDKALAELERRNGPLPPTVEAVTGSGGRHLYFSYPASPRPALPPEAGLFLFGREET